MKPQIDHGCFDEPGYRFDLKTLARFRKTLKAGQKVNLATPIDDDGNTLRKRKCRGEIKAVYLHIAVVEYPTTVLRCGVACGIIRRESFTLKELMIWNMGEMR